MSVTVRFIKLVALLLMSGLLIIGPVLPATADTVTVADPRGDKASRFDIERATYVNTERSIGAKVRVVDLRRRPAYFAATFQPRNAHDLVFTIATKRRRDGQTVSRITVSDELVYITRIPCKVYADWRFDLTLSRRPFVAGALKGPTDACT
jgi:hypothetical protein